MSWPVKNIPITECDRMMCQPGTYFELETAMIQGREEKVWTNLAPSFRVFLLKQLEQYSDRIMLNAPLDPTGNLGEREDVTYGEVARRALDLAAWLRKQGVTAGSFVGLVGYNSIEWVVGFVAIQLLGAVTVMVNAAVKPDSMAHCLNLVKPVVILADGPCSSSITLIQDELKDCGKVYAWSKLGVTGNVEVLDFKSMKVSPSDAADVKNGVGIKDIHPDSDSTIFYTSGTTGYPKAVLSSQRASLHNVISSQILLGRAALRAGAPLEMVMPLISNPPPDQRTILMVVPFFHATGCLTMLSKAFWEGSKLVLMPRWNVDDAIDLMIKYKVNVIGGVPSIATAIIQSPRLPKDLDLLGCSYGGAAPASRLPGDLRKRWPDLVSAHGWGMTETNALHTSNAGMDYVMKPKSCGVPVPICEVKIIDTDTRKELPTGKVGTILARGSNMMKEYYNNPKATKDAYESGRWLDTGDAGYLDDEGFLHISDRIKDIIIRGGENIPSEEVENAVFLDDRIAEVAAVPVPDDILGELVAIAVSLRAGVKATPEDIKAQAASRLRGPARPSFVVIYDGLLPRNINGKMIKMEIKKTVGDLFAETKQAPRAKL